MGRKLVNILNKRANKINGALRAAKLRMGEQGSTTP
jgi:hypothetical protein